MNALPSLSRLEELLRPYVAQSSSLEPRSVSLASPLLEQLRVYLELLSRWNTRVNLTAIREPEEMVRRHFGESLLLARLVPPSVRSVLDLGSGAGFPGLPIQLALPDLQVTLAESQGRKAAFLREAVRELGVGAEVWDRRAEELRGVRRFDAVALRAVDRMDAAVALAGELARTRLVLGSQHDLDRWGLVVEKRLGVPGSVAGSVAALCVIA